VSDIASQPAADRAMLLSVVALMAGVVLAAYAPLGWAFACGGLLVVGGLVGVGICSFRLARKEGLGLPRAVSRSTGRAFRLLGWLFVQA
jgi:hypothetical protein